MYTVDYLTYPLRRYANYIRHNLFEIYYRSKLIRDYKFKIKKYIPNIIFEYFYKKNSSTRAIYTFLDNAKLVLGIDSTASYEALARKNKSIMFHNRRIKNKNISIGWPQRKKNII